MKKEKKFKEQRARLLKIEIMIQFGVEFSPVWLG
jgi:hypothetical protein